MNKITTIKFLKNLSFGVNFKQYKMYRKQMVWEKLGHNSNGRAIMTNYIYGCRYHFTKVAFDAKKGTFSIIVQCHFKILVLQHWSRDYHFTAQLCRENSYNLLIRLRYVCYKKNILKNSFHKIPSIMFLKHISVVLIVM